MFQKNFRHFGSGPSTVCISFDLWKQNILQFFMVYSSQLIQARELLEKLILACAPAPSRFTAFCDKQRS